MSSIESGSVIWQIIPIALLIVFSVIEFYFVFKGYLDNPEGRLNSFLAHGIIRNDIDDSVWVRQKQ